MSESKIFPYSYQVRDLSNGLRVIVVPTDYPNIISLQIPVQVGSRNEVAPGKSGFAHFFEHMMFRGTEKYPPEQYQEILQNAGVNQNAYTSDDLTNYHMTFAKEDLEKILELEADRFQNLRYAVDAFKTEAKAVLGEYNKDASDPLEQLFEAQRDAAFQRHTYKHTTIGYLKDIKAMPELYEYSLTFFAQYYRPERTTIILAGDVQPEKAFQWVEKYWGDWQRGEGIPEIPQEPESQAPVYRHVDWPAATLPWVTVAFHGPAFSETNADLAAMNVIGRMVFSESSPLYQKLVVQEQKVDQLDWSFPARKDPYLLTVMARVKNIADMGYVREQILQAFAALRTEPVSAQQLADIKANLQYSFAQRMNSSEAIAEAMVRSVAYTRDPETINRVYKLYGSVDTAMIMAQANRYFIDKRLVVVSLAQGKLSGSAAQAGSVEAYVDAAKKESAKIETVLQRNASPIINFRILFNVGAAADPAGKQGLARLTASMITDAGSKQLSYAAIQRALFPMAAGFGAQVDKEMTVFAGSTHVDNLQAYYHIISTQLLEPAWNAEDFQRVKTHLLNEIVIDLRENNEEELGKEVLYDAVYRDHPYGHLNRGYVNALEELSLQDVQQFYHQHYTRANLVLGLAGSFPDAFLDTLQRDLQRLPAGHARRDARLPAPVKLQGHTAVIVEKDTRSTAVSFGFPIEVTRRDADFAALWLASSWLGEHRSSNGRLYQRIREIRGMNYGNYAYIEHFPDGMFQFHPDPNLGRQQQIFQIWIRPLESIENAHFATRAALYELDKLIEQGLTTEAFETSRNFLLKYVNILQMAQDQQLGYALDSRYYGSGDFNRFITQALQKLTLADVNRAIKKHLQTRNVQFVFVTRDATALRQRLIADAPAVMVYGSVPPKEVLEEDQIIQKYPLGFKASGVAVVPLEQVFMHAGWVPAGR